MERNDIEDCEGKLCKFFLRNNIVYHGRVLEIQADVLKIRDKFSNIVFISLDQIEVIHIVGGQQDGKYYS